MYVWQYIHSSWRGTFHERPQFISHSLTHSLTQHPRHRPQRSYIILQCVCVCVCVCVCARAHTHTCARTHTHTHTREKRNLSHSKRGLLPRIKKKNTPADTPGGRRENIRECHGLFTICKIKIREKNQKKKLENTQGSWQWPATVFSNFFHIYMIYII